MVGSLEYAPDRRPASSWLTLSAPVGPFESGKMINPAIRAGTA
jgi:hypothetical protein